MSADPEEKSRHLPEGAENPLTGNLSVMELTMKKRTIYLLSFLLPLITLICGMIYLGVAPFGDNSLLIIDGLHQYMPFFSVLSDKLKTGESLFYTFRTGLGVNFLSLFSYYLSSPLNLFVLLFKRSQLNMAVSFLVVFKLALSGLFAGICFAEKSRKPGLHVIAIAVAYALNGYMTGYCWNVMWLDAIMVFPLIILGIDRLIGKKDGRLYGIALFYALYCNYYIGFMICLFSVIYYLFHSFSGLKEFFRRGLVFFVYSMLAGGMAAVILVPAYLGIKATSSGNEMSLPSHSWITDFWDLISRQFDMAYPVTHDNFDGNANLYFGMFSVLFVFLYLLNKEIRIGEKIRKIILILFFYLCFNEEILNFIWHGFHDQYGIPNRFSFLYGFVLLTMAFDVLEHFRAVRIWEPVVSLILSLGIMGGCIYFGVDLPETEVFYAAGFLLAAYGVIVFLSKKKKTASFCRMLLPALMAGEMMVTCLIGFDSNGQISISKFFYATEDMEKAISENDDGTFYRSEVAEGKIVDESTWYPMHAVSLFGSTARDQMVDIMDSLGFGTGINEYLYKGATPVTNLMFNVRDLYYHEGDMLETEFTPAGIYGSMSLYRNPVEGMSIGYGISQDIDSWYYDSDYPFRVLNDFCYQGYWTNTVFEDIPVSDPRCNGCSVSRTNDGEYYFTYEENQPDNLVFDFDLDQGSDYLYIFYDGTQVSNVKISVDELVVVDGDMDGRIIPVGTIEKNSSVRVEMSLKGEQTNGYVRLSAASFVPEEFDHLVQEMTAQPFRVSRMNDHHIEGTFEAIEDEYLFFSIPYDEGWKVTVDGKNVETETIGNAFLSVIIPEGEHEITLDFLPPGLIPGGLVSVASVLCYLMLCLITVKKRKTEKNISDIPGGSEDEEEVLVRDDGSSPAPDRPDDSDDSQPPYSEGGQ